jgi:hypothetical protein
MARKLTAHRVLSDIRVSSDETAPATLSNDRRHPAGINPSAEPSESAVLWLRAIGSRPTHKEHKEKACHVDDAVWRPA